jgi:hypothetical protein
MTAVASSGDLYQASKCKTPPFWVGVAALKDPPVVISTVCRSLRDAIKTVKPVIKYHMVSM